MSEGGGVGASGISPAEPRLRGVASPPLAGQADARQRVKFTRILCFFGEARFYREFTKGGLAIRYVFNLRIKNGT